MNTRALTPDLGLRLNAPATVEAVRSMDVGALEHLLQIAFNPATLAVVKQALDLGVLEACREPRTMGELGALLGCEPDDVAVEMALELNRGLSLLEEKHGRFVASALTRKHLLQDAPLRITGLFLRNAHYLRLGLDGLTKPLLAARRSRPKMWTAAASSTEQKTHFDERQIYNESSITYFIDTAWLLFAAHGLDALSGIEHAVDVAGGPAAFAALVKRNSPSTRITDIEISLAGPSYRAKTEAWLSQAGLEVELDDSNVLQATFKPRYQLAFVNRLVCAIPKQDLGPWISKLREMLLPGGTLAFGDFFFTGYAQHDVLVSSLYYHWASSDFLAHEELRREGQERETDPRVAWGWLSRWSHAELAEVLEREGFEVVNTLRGPSPFSVLRARLRL
jgi:hypothetical protein